MQGWRIYNIYTHIIKKKIITREPGTPESPEFPRCPVFPWVVKEKIRREDQCTLHHKISYIPRIKIKKKIRASTPIKHFL